MNLTVDKSRVQTQDAIEKYFATDLPNSLSLNLPAISVSQLSMELYVAYQ